MGFGRSAGDCREGPIGGNSKIVLHLPRLGRVSCQLLAAGRLQDRSAPSASLHTEELIFGLQLANHAQAADTRYPTRSEIAGKPIAASKFSKAEVISAFKNLFSNTWARVSAATASQMIGGYFRRSKRMTYEEKPIALLAIATRKRLVGLVLLVPKRGGAVKALLMSETAHRDTLHGLLAFAEDAVRAAGRRKLYFLHPIADYEMISLFVARGYTAEGVLRSPYRQGQDATVYSRFF